MTINLVRLRDVNRATHEVREEDYDTQKYCGTIYTSPASAYRHQHPYQTESSFLHPDGTHSMLIRRWGGSDGLFVSGRNLLVRGRCAEGYMMLRKYGSSVADTLRCE